MGPLTETEQFATAVLWILSAYAAVGLAFSLLFVTVGLHRFDEQAKGSGIGFRLILVPGATIFWPWLLIRWIRGEEPQP